MFRLALGVILFLSLVGCGSVGIKYIDPGSPATPPSSIDYTALGTLLQAHVQGAAVDYPGLVGDRDALRRVVGELGAIGPTTHPKLFDSKAKKLAYYINAYNALVLLGVVEHYPISSVNDVHGPLKVTQGFGFFYGLRFPLDGKKYHLYGLEHEVIREFGDARIHGAINCASASCPTLLDVPYLPGSLDAQLDAAAARFASEPRHVSVDQEAKTITLSPIYDWFAEDFIAHSQRAGWGEGVLDYIIHFADDALKRELKAGVEAGFEVIYPEYDWGLNEAPRGQQQPLSAPGSGAL